MSRILGLSLLVACSGGKVPDDGEDTDDTEVVDTDDTDNADEVRCRAPRDLPPDPLVPAGGELSYQFGQNDSDAELVDVELGEGVAWFAGRPAVVVVDTRDPADPRELGIWEGVGRVDRIEVGDDGLVYAAAASVGLLIGDLSDPAAPVDLATVPIEAASAVLLQGDRVYVVARTGVIVPVDVSTPSAPVPGTPVDGLASPAEIVAVSDHAWVADNVLGLVPVDLTAPDAPVVGAPVATGGAAQDLALTPDGATALVAAGAAGVLVFDLADPSAPIRIGQVDVGRGAVAVHVDGDVAWVSTQGEIVAVDVSDPASPVVRATEATPGFAMHLAAQDGVVWVADWYRVAAYTWDAERTAPDLSWSWDVLGLPPGGGVARSVWTNRGSAPLEVLGVRHDPDLALTLETRTLAPGASTEVSFTWAGGAPAFKDSVCVVTNDPDAPVRLLTVTTGLPGGGTFVGQQAPDFVLRDLDGGTHRLSDQLGKPVVLASFATWCPICPTVLGDIEQSIWRPLQDQGVVVYGISDEEPDLLRRFAAHHGLTFPILRDEDGSVAASYNQLSSVPAAPFPRDWIVGADGRVAYRSNELDVPAMLEVIGRELAAE